METTEVFGIVSLALNLLLSSGLIVTLVTLRSVQEKAREEVKRAKIESDGLAIDNDRKVSELVNEYFVEPLKKDIASLRCLVSRLTRAIEKIPLCPHSANCPVKYELDANKPDEQ